MLCEMRGYDGSMSGWNGSHGSADSSRGLCVFRKMEIGAYVVNSNQASYYQCENDADVVFANQESRHHGYPDSWHHELRASKMYVTQRLDKEHKNRRMERSILHERHQPDYGSTVITTSEKYSTNTTENYWVSTQEMETNNQPADSSVAGNIYQGPIVRVQVPEVYYEGRSTKGPETAGAYRQNTDHERMGQNLQGAREIYGSPVSETYRRINEWLKNCQQHSSSKSSKASHVSYGSNHSRTETKLMQNTTSGNFSKADYRLQSQTGNVSNLKLKAGEPRFVAALEPKAVTAGNALLQRNHQHKDRNTDWIERHNVPYQHENQSVAPRNNDVTISFSSNVDHVMNTTKPFYESGPSKTSSEWSSETLSIAGSDKSSYCTDFTPFELGSADSSGGIYQIASTSTSARDRSPNIGHNVLISHVMIDDRMQGKNITQAHQFSDALHDSLANELACNRRNDKSNFNSVWDTKIGQKSKQQRLQDRLTDKPPKNSADSLHASKTGSVVTVFIGDAQRTQQGNSQFGSVTKQSIGMQNSARSRKAMADPNSLAEDVQNVKIVDRRLFKGDRNLVQVPSDKKLYISDGKPIIPLRCTSLEHPLSSRFTDKGQRFSIPADKSGFKESSSEEVSTVHKQLKSRPELRSGSLSITIRPNRLTVMDYFKKIDDVWDSSGRKAEPEPELKGSVELSNDIESLQEISNDTATDAKAFASNGLNSGSGDDVSDESEELDEFTKTIIRADISGKALQSSSKAEFPLKPQYNALKLSKHLKPDTSTLLADLHHRFSGNVCQMLDDKNTESGDVKDRALKEQGMFESHIPLNSVPSFHASPEQPQERGYRMQFTKNEGLVDDRFGHNSEYMKCKYEDVLETNFRSSSEKNPSEMNLSASEFVSKNSCPDFQSFIRNHSDSHNYISGAMLTPAGSAEQVALVSDELHTDDRSHIETASPRSLPHASEIVSDGFHNHAESVKCSKAKATTDRSNEEDRFLISLLQNRTPDLPISERFCTPHLQSRNLVHTSDFTMQPYSGDNSEQTPLKSRTVHSDKQSALKPVMKSPRTFERRNLQGEELNSLDFKLLTRNIYESRRDGRKDRSEEFYQQISKETDYSRRSLESSPKCQTPKSDSMIHEKAEEDIAQQGNNCSKISKNNTGPSFIISNTMQNSEPMYCQELIEFPENLVIDPPESFSDFTIML